MLSAPMLESGRDGFDLHSVSKSTTGRPYIGRAGSSQAAVIALCGFGVVLARLSTGQRNGQRGTRRDDTKHSAQQGTTPTYNVLYVPMRRPSSPGLRARGHAPLYLLDRDQNLTANGADGDVPAPAFCTVS